MTSTPVPATPPPAELLVLDHISPPRDISLDDYQYTKLPPIPIGAFTVESQEQAEEGEEAKQLKSILGHEMKKKDLYYYVEMTDGSVERMAAEDVQKRRDLLRIYEMKSRNGKLRAFDPRTDPRLSALKIKIDVRKTQIQRSPSYEPEPGGDGYSTLTSPPLTTPPETSEPTTEEDLGSDGAYSEGAYSEDTDTVRPTRRSARTATQSAPRKHGPSPKKTRARAREMEASEEVTESEYGESEIDVDSDSDMYEDTPVRRGVKGKKFVRGRPPPHLELGDLYEMTKNTPSERELAKIDSLHAHRETCEKCRQKPAHLLRKKGRRKQTQPRSKYDDTIVHDGDDKQPEELGGWLKCMRCCHVAHWDCVSPAQRLEVIRAVRATTGKPVWQGLPMGEMSAYLCGSCTRGAECMGCGKIVPEGVDRSKAEKSKTPASSRQKTPVPGENIKPEASNSKEASNELMDIDYPDRKDTPLSLELGTPEESSPLLFRCTRCKRASHYACMSNPPRALSLASDSRLPLDELAQHYQQAWECDQCERWRFPVELVLAWRAAPGVNAKVEARRPANYKAPLKREYLIKWQDRSFARLEWVPHAWLAAVSGARLKNFLDGGRKIELLAEGGAVAFETSSGGSSGPEPEAESRIPEAWRRIDRLLDVRFWKPNAKMKGTVKRAAQRPSKRKSTKRSGSVLSDSQVEDVLELSDDIESADSDSEETDLRVAIMREGQEPAENDIEDAEGRIQRLKRQRAKRIDITEDDVKDIAWCYIKWEDLGYEQATWDSPYPRKGQPFEGMERAFHIFVQGRTISHRPLTAPEIQRLDRAYAKAGKPEELTEQPDFAKGGTLFPFQLQGVSWLWLQWWQKRSAILADEMGLGKTVQVITFLNLIYSRFQVSPFLIVVPNSTLTNWTREFARWAPNMHVTPFFGEAAARKTIKEYELFHTGRAGYRGKDRRPELSTDVIITSYETVTGSDRSVFNSVSRWEVLVVDESQKIKNDSSLIFKRLREMNSAHRVLMTGTPLNNNIRELFNLMHFLDPDNWNDLDRLEREYAELDEEKIKQLHTELKPYFLRRIKEDELDLPARNEVIVPLSMSTLQKEVYRGLLSRNAELIGQLVGNISASTTKAAQIKKGSLNNLLMELRKCLQHPYLVSRDLEPKDLPDAELHRVFMDASTKLVFLKSMLRQLKERGHRVLLFSQFVIALDIVEDFLIGEGFKYMRLDGNTKQSDRQKGLDQFNQEGSEYFIYLLSTRAGGVGINLTSADTVIIFDPDFNPHMDHQAIARAHRIGQTKPVLVFKLMVKDSAEEKIVQAGKKKLILDHLIVQKMDVEDEGMNDVQTILSFGARALFEEEAGKKMQEIAYSDQDIHNLIVKTEDDGKTMTEKKSNESTKAKGLAFDFAKVWEASKGALEELQDDTAPEQQGERLQDFWTSVAKRAAAEEAERQSKIILGRGGRRAAAAAVPKYFAEDEMKQKRKKKKDASKNTDNENDQEPKPRSGDDSDAAEGSDFVAPSEESVSDDDDIVALDGPGMLPDDVDVYLPSPEKPKKSRPRKNQLLQVAPVGSSAPLPPHLTSDTSITPAPRVTYGLPSNPYSQSSQHIIAPPGGTVSPFFAPGPPRPQPAARHLGPKPEAFVTEVATIPMGAAPTNPPRHHARSELSQPRIISPHAAALPSMTGPPMRPIRPLTPHSDDASETGEQDGPCSLCGEVHGAGQCRKLRDIASLEAVKERILASNETDETRIPALALINDLLTAAHGQRSQLAQPPAALSRKRTHELSSAQMAGLTSPRIGPPAKRRKSSTHAYPVSGATTSGNQNISPSRGSVRTTFATVPPPPLVSRIALTQTNGAASMEPCPHCGGNIHNPAQCAVLAASPLALKRAITKLSGDPQRQQYVEELKKLLLKRHGIPYSDSPAPRLVSGPSRQGIQGVPVNAPLQSLGNSSGSGRHGILGVPVNAPLQSLGGASGPIRQGIRGVPVNAPLQSLGNSGFPARAHPLSQIATSNALNATGCLICHRPGHPTKDCPTIQFMNDSQLKSAAKALKRVQGTVAPGEAVAGINAVWHKRAELKAMKRARKKQLANASHPPASPGAEVIELSD
ncbi:hypothetical protein CALVIDRAFT_502015 [Calocera viscosa TUFC12733]|uniref:Uncharacterized protein n=1 Tax=Calocera viscosa (strain TUFC12733) TaxID=1330018 RepID=A0A167JWZ8_CALVF|nr:hypothetical protein CALVIDRAFT_502015 [Calocera viscosa TUFC12733]